MRRLEDTHWWFVARRNLVLTALRRVLRASAPPPAGGRPRHILDVGCGTGAMLTQLRPFGRVVGLDREPLALQFCRERGHRDLVCASATVLPFADNAFDVIVALDVIEHIADDKAALREIARVLVPGGHAFLTVPAYRSLWSGHDVALMHQRRYVAREVKQLALGAGLRVSRVSYTVSALLPLVGAIRLAQRLQKNRPVRADAVPTARPLNALLRAYLDWESRLALRARLPFGLTVFAIVTK